MKTNPAFPTPHPEVNAVLDALLPDVQAILGAHFVGLYLHGSLAYGDFNPQTSDIDFLVVTDGNLSLETFSELKEMHARLFTSGRAWSRKLEGAYLPKDDLRRHDPAHAPIPWLGVDGHFAFEGLGSDWIIQRWILRKKGIVVAGSPLKPMIDPVSAADLRGAVRGSLREWWSPPFPSPERFQSGEYRAYAIQTMCRSLYVLEFGRVASKPEAARWAAETFARPWRGLIHAATDWAPGAKSVEFEETARFIGFTLKQAGLPA
ncbi:MAG: Streptomycin 3''-adenylyltransferase [Anaerolineaceae bacterium]|nr:MAG: Streptomycin 3''-adenylyltransferase [Anaerolineaceae bacterium]